MDQIDEQVKVLKCSKSLSSITIKVNFNDIKKALFDKSFDADDKDAKVLLNRIYDVFQEMNAEDYIMNIINTEIDSYIEQRRQKYIKRGIDGIKCYD